MTQTTSTFNSIAADCAAHGLAVLAALHAEPDDAPDAETLLLIGNAGPAMWRAFKQSAEFKLPRHALDTWSRRVIGNLAARYGAVALFPFGGPPYHPFQRWASRSGMFSASPLGVLVHPSYGPWFAFRGALAFPDRIDIPATEPADPCGTCRDKPCLTACPVDAISAGRAYDAVRCRDHVSRRNNQCFNTGCLARHACPLGRDFVYEAEQARFHMDAFAD